LRSSLTLISAMGLFLQTPSVSAESLPGGNDGSFRARMLNWSTDAAVTAPHQAVSVQAPQSLHADETAQLRLPRLSSRFGDRRDPIEGRVRHHAGIDIPGALGTPVLSVEEGAVVRAGWAGGYGNMIEIEHPGGLRTRYAHLSSMRVAAGTTVAQGQTIGEMGSTGHSTGSHLHFEVRRAGVAMDPLHFFGRGPEATPAQPVVPLEPFVTHRSRFAQLRDQAASTGRTGL